MTRQISVSSHGASIGARHLLVGAGLLALAACATGGSNPAGVTPNPHYKVGRPYTIKGERYIPREDPNYREEGIASWYGPNFHGKLTANGEVFDQDRLTAAHKTLPLPSLVRVTNLENGRSAVLRLNDRGPFSGSRIIDLSKKAAEDLGSREKGLARVRVEYLGPADLDHAILATGLKEDRRALRPRRTLFGSNQAPAAPPPGPSEAERLTLAAAERRAARVAAAPASSPVPVRGAAGTALPVTPMVARPPVLTARNGQARAVPVSMTIGSDTTDDGIEIVFADEGARRLVDGNTPAARPAEATPAPRQTHASLPAGMPTETYFVQVGIFADEANAMSASTDFLSTSRVQIDTVRRGTSTTHYVKLGPFADQAAARNARSTAISKGFIDALIVPGSKGA